MTFTYAGDGGFGPTAGTLLGTAPVNGADVASLTLPTLSFGSHSVQATYNGEPGFSGSSSPIRIVTINPVATTTTATASDITISTTEPVTLTATVAAPGSGTPDGAVTFTSNLAGLLGTVTLNPGGQAALLTPTLPVGTHTISVSYLGAGGLAVSSTTLTVTVAAESTNRLPDLSRDAPTQACFWSPNHKFETVGISGITDADGDPLTITIRRITSDEGTRSAPGTGGGNKSPDGAGIGTSTASIRVERSGSRDGRISTRSRTTSATVTTPSAAASRWVCPTISAGAAAAESTAASSSTRPPSTKAVPRST